MWETLTSLAPGRVDHNTNIQFSNKLHPPIGLRLRSRSQKPETSMTPVSTPDSHSGFSGTGHPCHLLLTLFVFWYSSFLVNPPSSTYSHTGSARTLSQIFELELSPTVSSLELGLEMMHGSLTPSIFLIVSQHSSVALSIIIHILLFVVHTIGARQNSTSFVVSTGSFAAVADLLVFATCTIARASFLVTASCNFKLLFQAS